MPTAASPPKATTTPRSELRQIGAAQRGDELALQRLLRRHHSLLAAHATRFYLPGGDHDDVLQEARIAFAKAVQGYRPDVGASFRTFAALCITRQLASAVTGARRNKHLALSDARRGEEAERAWADMHASTGDPTDHALAAERRRELQVASSSLTALERQALGHALVGWSSGQTAHRLGLQGKTADNALQRARRKVEQGTIAAMRPRQRKAQQPDSDLPE